MRSRTTKVGEGSTSANEIAAKALQVLERLARNTANDEHSAEQRPASAHAPGDSDASENANDEDAGLGDDDTSDARANARPYHFDPDAVQEPYSWGDGDAWDDGEDGERLDPSHYADDYEYAAVDSDDDVSALGRRPRLFDGRERRSYGGGRDFYESDDARGARHGVLEKRRSRRFGFADDGVDDETPYRLSALGDSGVVSSAHEYMFSALGVDVGERFETPNAALVGGALKIGKDASLDAFTPSFEDQWGLKLDDRVAKMAKAKKRRSSARMAEAAAYESSSPARRNGGGDVHRTRRYGERERAKTKSKEDEVVFKYPASARMGRLERHEVSGEGTSVGSESSSDSETGALFLEALSRRGASADRSELEASETATSSRDPDPEIPITSKGATSSTFAIRDFGLNDVPSINGGAARMYADGGREYLDALYEKSADWVNQKYDAVANTTRLWVDAYEESGRSKKRVNVAVFVDAADPYSLELILGPIQNLLKMDLGPLAWTFHAHSNLGRRAGGRVNCAGETGDSATRLSCLSNAAVQCSQKTFQNMTSGLRRFEQRAEEMAARRAQVTRGNAALGELREASLGEASDDRIDDGFEREVRGLSRDVGAFGDADADAGNALPRAPSVSRGSRVSFRRGFLRRSLSADAGGAASDEPASEEDALADLFKPDDAEVPEFGADGLDVTSYDLPVPSFLEATRSTDFDPHEGDDAKSPLNLFLTCFSTKLLEYESAGASRFDGGEKAAALEMSASCCETAYAEKALYESRLSLDDGNVSSSARVGNALLETTCREQALCLSSGEGVKDLSSASDLLESLRPKHEWLPWVLVEHKPVCVHSCNLQQAIRRAVCNNREGTLPGDCPRFPWSKIWYDEPGVSFAGVAGVVFGVVLTTGSMTLLAQQAGCLCFRRRKVTCDESGADSTGETSPLLNTQK